MKEDVKFRTTIGLLAVVGGLFLASALLWVEVPPGNRDALMLALGIVLGWGAAVVNNEYGSSVAGKKAADVAIRKLEENQVQPVKVVGSEADPVHTTEK